MRIILSILIFFTFFSCKTFPDYPQIQKYFYNKEEYSKGKDCSFIGKVLYKGKKLHSVAIRLAIDKDYCEMSYTDFDGIFDFCLDTTKINEQSYIEFVSEGYERKKIWLKKFLKTDKIVELKKGKKNVSAKEYIYFHENIRGCSLFSDVVEENENMNTNCGDNSYEQQIKENSFYKYATMCYIDSSNQYFSIPQCIRYFGKYSTHSFIPNCLIKLTFQVKKRIIEAKNSGMNLNKYFKGIN